MCVDGRLGGANPFMFDWIVRWVESGGYLAIAFLMLLENVFPPIPSELIMPLAGFAAAKGTLNIVGVVAAGTAGSLAGALFWFWVG
jgi:membrane protein DedA with SNARE-associated domain